MFNQKPDSSLIEDLQALGLLAEGEKLAKGGKKEITENMGGPMAPDASVTGHEEPDGDEAAAPAAAPAPPAAKTPPMPSKLASTAPPPKSDDAMGGGYDAAGAAPAAADDSMSDDDEVAAYESAWDCVKQYYALNEKKEKLSEDDYKTVVNAMAFIIETQGKYMGPDQLDKDPETLPGGSGQDWKGDGKNDPTDKVPGPLAMKKIKGFKYHLSSPKPGEKAESLDALVSELKGLTQKTESEDEMQELGNKIIEGFEAVRDTAQEIAESIAKELKESNERVTEAHPRLKLGKFFEGLSGDAKLLLKAISERETTDVDDAIEDLNSLARDLKKGLAQY
jgi:hypothetical protein